MSDLSLSSLQLILKEFSERYRQFSSDDIFTLWFLRAYVTSSEQQAAEAVVGGAGARATTQFLSMMPLKPFSLFKLSIAINLVQRAKVGMI